LLKNDLSRLAYIYLHTSPHGNSVGAFICPPELAALDVRRKSSEIRKSFQELNSSGLIRYDEGEELVQIVGFLDANPPTSRKHLAGPKRALESLPQCPLKLLVAADLAISIYKRAKTWGTEVDARASFMQDAANLINKNNLKQRLVEPNMGLSESFLIGLSNDLMIDLDIAFITNITTKTNTKTTTTTKTNTTTKTKTTGQKPPISRKTRSPELQSPPSRGGQSVPDDVGAIISELQRKAAK